MKILIIGQGGREHALAWKMAQSPLATEIYVAPGNGGTAMENKCQNINIAADDCAALLDFAQQQHIDLTVVGPEAPLALGLVDQFHAHGLTCFGPSQAAAQLESSKAFCKQFMQEHAKMYSRRDGGIVRHAHLPAVDCAQRCQRVGRYHDIAGMKIEMSDAGIAQRRQHGDQLRQ